MVSEKWGQETQEVQETLEQLLFTRNYLFNMVNKCDVSND